jgi:hypothetical protein
MKKSAVGILMKYLVFLLGCGLVLAGFTSWFANPTQMQIVFSALAAVLGALLVTLGLASPPKQEPEKNSDEKLAAEVIENEDQLDAHNSFHSPSDIYENEKEDAKDV